MVGSIIAFYPQTVQQQLPSHHHVKGAKKLFENKNTSMTTWEWSKLNPTDLRTHPMYSKVSLEKKILS